MDLLVPWFNEASPPQVFSHSLYNKILIALEAPLWTHFEGAHPIDPRFVLLFFPTHS